MEERYRQKFRIPSARLPTWDYGSNALYFITICTKDRVPYFGEILNDEFNQNSYLKRTAIGDVAYNNWLTIPQYHPYVQLDEFIVMPDHLHGILLINNTDNKRWDINKFGPQSKNLASIVRGYKSSVKQHATLNELTFSWQQRFYDRIIRNEKEYCNIKAYIYDNPNNWLLKGDDMNIENLHLMY